MGLLDAPQIGDDAGIRMLLGRVAALETQVQQAMAAYGSLQALIQAQQQITATLARISAQTALHTVTQTMTWNADKGIQVAIPVPAWATVCVIDGAGETTASTIPSNKTLLVDLWADSAPIATASGVWIGEASGYDGGQGDVAVFLNVLDVAGKSSVYLRPVTDADQSDAGSGSITFDLALRVMWL